MGTVRILVGCCPWCWFALGGLFWSASGNQIFYCPRRRCHNCLLGPFWCWGLVTLKGPGLRSDGRCATSSNDWFLCLLLGRSTGAWRAYLGWPTFSFAKCGTSLLTINPTNRWTRAAGACFST